MIIIDNGGILWCFTPQSVLQNFGQALLCMTEQFHATVCLNAVFWSATMVILGISVIFVLFHITLFNCAGTL